MTKREKVVVAARRRCAPAQAPLGPVRVACSLGCLTLQAILVLAAAGCADSDSADALSLEFPGGELLEGGSGAADGTGMDPFGPGTNGGASPVSDGDLEVREELPEEIELNLDLEKPRAGARSVYIPNPTSDRVAVVNASTFAIESVEAGDEPNLLQTAPSRDLAVVLNAGSGDATVLRTEQGKTSAETLPIGHQSNALAMSPDGKHAIAFLDVSRSPGTGESFQEVSVITLEESPSKVVQVTVGFRPRAVQFSSDGGRAFVVTEDGICEIVLADLEGKTAALARVVSVGDPFGQSLSTDVSVTADGLYAVARRSGEASIRLVTLSDGSIETLDLSALQEVETLAGDAGVGVDAGTPAPGLPAGALVVSDLDLAPDGSFALAVERQNGALLRIPIPAGFSDASLVQVIEAGDSLVGSVTLGADGHTAALFTTAVSVEGLILLDLDSEAPARAVRLRKGVRSVALTEDGSKVLVLHDKTDGNAAEVGLDEETRIDRSEAYSLVDVGSGFARLQLTSARVDQFVLTPDNSHLFVLLRDDARAVREVQVADLDSFMTRGEVLQSPPASLGVVPEAGKVFIGQESAGGMITFIDWLTDEVRTVTGFELASRIRQ